MKTINQIFSNGNLNVYNTFIKSFRIYYNVLIISTPAAPPAPSNSLSIFPTHLPTHSPSYKNICFNICNKYIIYKNTVYRQLYITRQKTQSETKMK